MKVRLAAGLWLIFAILVWNVVFDRMIVLAGRRYSHAAVTSVRHDGVYLRIDDWMRPAVGRAKRVASVVAGVTAAFGLSGVAVASRRERYFNNSSKKDTARGSFD